MSGGVLCSSGCSAAAQLGMLLTDTPPSNVHCVAVTGRLLRELLENVEIMLKCWLLQPSGL